MKKAIDGVLARIKYLTKRVRRLGADAHKAEGQRKHFAKVAKDAHADYVKAEKMGKQGAMAQAKARTQRAHRKVAYWDEQADDAKHGYRRSVKRREHQRKKFRELKKIHRDRKDASSGGDTGRVLMDGRPVPGWLAHDLQKAKNAGLWGGYVVSGVRTSAQSTALCYGICGRPTCSGICAGTSSNHNCDPCNYPEGAADVTDFYRCTAARRSWACATRTTFRTTASTKAPTGS